MQIFARFPLWRLLQHIDPYFFANFPSLTDVSFGGYPRSMIDLSKNVKLESIWAHDMPNMRQLKTIYVHPDVDIDSLTVVKDNDVTIQILRK